MCVNVLLCMHVLCLCTYCVKMLARVTARGCDKCLFCFFRFRFSKSWLHSHRSGQREASQKRLAWLRSAGLLGYMQSVPTGKTHDVSEMKTHIKFTLRLLARVVKHSCNGKVTSLRLVQYGRRKRALDALCERIVKGGVDENDKRRVVIAYGDAVFPPHGYCGPYAKTVRNALKHRGYEVNNVCEYNSSKLCNGCKNPCVKMRDRDGRDIYALERCLSPSCPRVTMHHDANGSANIRCEYMYSQNWCEHRDTHAHLPQKRLMSLTRRA